MSEYSAAARTVVAGLKILREHAKRAGLPVTTMDLIYHAETRIADEIPPWEPEPAASVTLPWSQVACGDSVQAPNGQWYPVDSIARLGSGAMSVLLIGPGGATVKSTPKAGDKVPVRRGPAGQAMDVLTAGGLELSLITSGT